MKKKSAHDMPAGELSHVRDFLPPPDKLILPEESVKVTLYLSKASVDFFKHAAEYSHTKYQRMIRELVDQYAAYYARSRSTR